MKFTGNVVLLTGASMGIGEQIAYRLAGQSAKLMLAARSTEKLAEVAQACRERGAQAEFYPTDLTDEAQCKRLIDHTVQVYGRIDTLLYNAGKGYPQRFDTLPNLDTVRSEIALNYLGLVYCVYYGLPYLKQSQGRLVAVSSLGSFAGIAGTAGYNASKHALRGFLNSLRSELIGTGVTITVVYPGAIRTKRLEETMGTNVNKVPTMTPERCAELTVWAAGARRRQLVMTLEGKLMVLLYPWLQGIFDRQLARIAELYSRQP